MPLVSLPPLWSPIDVNDDGHVSGDDLIDFEPGSLEAKQAWTEIESSAFSNAAKKHAASEGYEDADGWYADKPLRKGPHAGDGDFQLVRDRLVWYKGMTPEVATKIAAKIKVRLYGVS
jgi:hypothetical protein